MANDKDLIIGGISNYTWDDIKYWINSIKKSEFDGDVVVVGTNISGATIKKLTERGVIVSAYGEPTDDGGVSGAGFAAPHVERFFYIWNHLNSTETKYRYVVTTDTRDVVFQKNPSGWLDIFLGHRNKCLVASSEGLLYKDEPWGNTNLFHAFGPHFHKVYKDSLIQNVGVIAGKMDAVRSMMLMIFQMSINRPIAIVDQAVYNVIVNNTTGVEYTTNRDIWAIQLGTTEKAVAVGSGDLGAKYKNAMKSYAELYVDDQPLITKEGLVLTQDEHEYIVVHQYDRIPGLKELIQKEYDDQ